LKYKRTGIIIQARLGSTRLPNKIMLPYYKGSSIIEILTERLRENYRDIPFIVATSTNQSDDRLADMLEKKLIRVFRGSENNVLERFIEGAFTFKFDNIIRICADNPFLDIKGTMELVDEHFKSMSDYTGYKVKGDIPSIRSHSGLWGEVVSLKALQKVLTFTNKKIYLEHVTNYIYENKDVFNVNLVKAPENLCERDDIRLTVDTKEDFEMNKEIFSKIVLGNKTQDIRPAAILKFLDKNTSYLELMKKQILKNSK
jgi:spore coat polysaccharide biosynthesis protein SpsF